MFVPAEGNQVPRSLPDTDTFKKQQGFPSVGFCKTLAVDPSHGNGLKMNHALLLLKSIHHCLGEMNLVDGHYFYDLVVLTFS